MPSNAPLSPRDRRARWATQGGPIRIVTALALLACLAASARCEQSEPTRTTAPTQPERPFTVDELRALAGNEAWRAYPANPVLTRGSKDEWDGWAVGSMSALKVEDTYHMYYEGWGKGTIQIGHAISPDGVRWRKDPANPVLPHGANGWDSGGTWDPFVLYEDGVFKMWYGATPKDAARGNFQWGVATSTDGSRFAKRRKISNFARGEVEDDHIVHDPKSRSYYMYYWDRNYEPMGLFRARSPNETDFDFRHAARIKTEGLSYPAMYKFTHVFLNNGTWYRVFARFVRPACAGCRTGYATSRDGLHWRAQNPNLILGQDAEILKVDGDLYLMYYGPAGLFDSEGCDIRLALFAGNLDDLAGRR
jgi:hypothetical protein